MRRFGLTLLLAFGFALAPSARGQEPGLAERVAALEKRVAELEERLNKLQGLAPKPQAKQALMEDLNKLRQIAGLVVSDKVRMKDGALDVYAYFKNAGVTRENYSVLRSSRSGTGPTDEEIERGDYTNFPWARLEGELKLGSAEPTPLVWEKRPGADGKLLVALSDGSARAFDKEEVKKLLVPKSQSKVSRMEDINKLRNLVGLVVTADKQPIKDGKLDLYSFVRKGDITRDNYPLFRSARSGTGPTDAEIESGDYTNFPWERREGNWTPGVLVPLLWEKSADAKGEVLVGYSDGSVKSVDEEDLADELDR